MVWTVSEGWIDGAHDCVCTRGLLAYRSPSRVDCERVSVCDVLSLREEKFGTLWFDVSNKNAPLASRPLTNTFPRRGLRSIGELPPTRRETEPLSGFLCGVLCRD